MNGRVEREDELPGPQVNKRHVTDSRSFLEWIAGLAKREGTFGRSSVVALNALKNIRTFPAIYRLARMEPFAAALRTNPRLILRCLTQDYLVRGFSVGVSARCFLYHHRRLQLALSSSFLRRLTMDQVTLFEVRDEETHVSVTVGQTRPLHDKEGELDMYLRVEGKPVFVLSFTVVPGWAAGSAAREVVLISRMQGLAGCYPEIKLARKVLKDVAPNALLLACVQGIALALGIEELASVNSFQQTAYRDEYSERLQRNYEEFFGELGIEKNNAGFLVSAIPIPEKPMACIKTGHKLRTKEKRAIKLAVRTACFELVRAKVVGEQTSYVRLIQQRSEARQAPQTDGLMSSLLQ